MGRKARLCNPSGCWFEIRSGLRIGGTRQIDEDGPFGHRIRDLVERGILEWCECDQDAQGPDCVGQAVPAGCNSREDDDGGHGPPYESSSGPSLDGRGAGRANTHESDASVRVPPPLSPPARGVEDSEEAGTREAAPPGDPAPVTEPSEIPETALTDRIEELRRRYTVKQLRNLARSMKLKPPRGAREATLAKRIAEAELKQEQNT